VSKGHCGVATPIVVDYSCIDCGFAIPGYIHLCNSLRLRNDKWYIYSLFQATWVMKGVGSVFRLTPSSSRLYYNQLFTGKHEHECTPLIYQVLANNNRSKLFKTASVHRRYCIRCDRHIAFIPARLARSNTYKET
jgi:hypothetical protein